MRGVMGRRPGLGTKGNVSAMSAQLQSDGVGDLEALLATAKERVAERPAIAKISYSHEAMIDLIIAHPGISQNALAQHFGYTASWISQIISSDTFQSALAKRREQLVDPVIAAEVETQFKSLVSRSLDILHQKLNRPAIEIPDNLALRALEIGSRAAGYGVKDNSPPAPATPAEVHIHLEQLGGGLVALLQRKRAEAQSQVIDVTPGATTEATIAAQQIAQLTNDVPEEH